MKKNLIVTFTVVTAISLGILTGCGAHQATTSNDPLTNPTQIEQMVEEDGSSETTDATTQTSKKEEAPNETTQTDKENTCEHTWETVTEYTTEIQLVHHDEETKTIVDKEAWDEEVKIQVPHITHHEAVTHVVHHEEQWGNIEASGFQCDCGHFEPVYYFDCPVCHGGTSSNGTIYGKISDAWDETVVDQTAYDETTYTTETQIIHHEAQTHTETIAAYDEEVEVQVPHTVERCTECGEEKK